MKWGSAAALVGLAVMLGFSSPARADGYGPYYPNYGHHDWDHGPGWGHARGYYAPPRFVYRPGPYVVYRPAPVYVYGPPPPPPVYAAPAPVYAPAPVNIVIPLKF